MSLVYCHIRIHDEENKDYITGYFVGNLYGLPAKKRYYFKYHFISKKTNLTTGRNACDLNW